MHIVRAVLDRVRIWHSCLSRVSHVRRVGPCPSAGMQRLAPPTREGKGVAPCSSQAARILSTRTGLDGCRD